MSLAHDAASLNDIAANSAAASRALLCEKLGRNDVELRCVYPPFLCFCIWRILFYCCRCCCVGCLRYVGYSGPVEGEGVRVAQKTKLRFTWQFLADDFSQSFDVHLLCRHAARHGVHLPKAWKNQLNLGLGLPVVDALADSAIRRVREELDLSDVLKFDCRPRCMHTRARFCALTPARVYTRARTIVCTCEH